MAGWIVVIGLCVAALLMFWVAVVYNRLVPRRQRVNQAVADIAEQLKQRHDLIPNLVGAVKRYAVHERGVFDDVVRTRNAAIAAQGPAVQAAAEDLLTSVLRQLLAVAEAYPELKAEANFQQLQAELANVEKKIAVARRLFNDAVREYNTGIRQFPAALFATLFGFTTREFFDVGGAETQRATSRP